MKSKLNIKLFKIKGNLNAKEVKLWKNERVVFISQPYYYYKDFSHTIIEKEICRVETNKRKCLFMSREYNYDRNIFK
jgi:hypothetical protein